MDEIVSARHFAAIFVRSQKICLWQSDEQSAWSVIPRPSNPDTRVPYNKDYLKLEAAQMPFLLSLMGITRLDQLSVGVPCLT
jgi:hypothetical protein